MKISASLAVFGYRPAALLRASGPDAATFLQGQFTNDLRQVNPAGAVYGLWLDRKGRVLADSEILHGADSADYFIASLHSPASVIARHLGEHIIADDVAVADETGSWRGISLIGAGAGAWLASEPRAGFVFPGRRASGENWEWIHRESDAAAASASVSGARVAGPGEVERMRIASGIPSIPADIGPADLPNEGGLDAVAISYSKGCYTGQEVMARIKSLGRVRRTLVRVRGASAPPALPAALWLAGRREGELRSAAPDAGGYAGLALLSVAAASAGGPLALAEGAGPTVEILRGP
jgi:folate-binding protein YgfZ